MQNKPNFSRDLMNVTTYITKDYENIQLYGRCENKPNQTQFWVCNLPTMIINGGYNDFQD